MNDVWGTAREIESLQSEVSRIAERYYKDRAIKEEVDQKNAKAAMLGEQLAKESGSLHGWKLAQRQFSLDQLAENRKARNWRKGECFQGGAHLDHPSWYRLTGSPIAIAVQNYAPLHREDLDEECRRKGLVWQEVTDFPSWHYPGSTKLVLITRPKLPR
jgi:hypothetical protein